jgi:long-chain acyl-CoA synthetase
VRTHLASLVEEFRHHAEETAVVAHRGIRRYRTTYGELAQLAGRFAAELDRRAIPPGERIVLWGANSSEWISAFFGCLLRGVIAVPLDAAGLPEFASRVIQDVAPKLIVGDPNLIHHLTGAEEIPHLWLFELSTQLPIEPNYAVSEAVTGQTPFQIVFTSGTTSEPKGIVHTHANVLSSVGPIEREMNKYRKYERWVHPLRFLHTLPLSHVFGQFMGLWLPPLLAGEVHFADQIEARRMTDLIRRERISVLVAVPRVLQLLRTHLLSRFDSLADQVAQAPKSHKLLPPKQWWQFRQVHSALGWKFWAVISGGAALPEEIEQFWNRIGIALIQGYGMTETTALVTLNHPFKIAQGTIGKTLPGREVRLSDEGEILVRGDMLAGATWQHGAMRKREGEWLATGDLGVQNENGELKFLGRKGDVIVTSGGMNIHPDDLEQAMKKQAGIRDCVVVPCGTMSGIEPVAVVLLSDPDAQLQEAVVAANRELADFQQIRRALKWPELQFPYTSTGKLLRRKIADWVCQDIHNQQTPGPHSAQTGTDIVLDMIAEVSGERVSNAGDAMRLTEDMHLDSLGRVQIQSALEQRLNIELPDDALASVETLGALRAILAEQAAPEALVTAPHEAPAAHATPAPAPTPSPSPSNPEPAAEPNTQPVAPPPAAGHQAPAPYTDDQVRGRSEDAQQALTSEHLYPRWPWAWPITALRIVFYELVIRPLTWLLATPRVVNKSGEIPSGPMLVIANHVSRFDGALVLYGLPGKIRRHIAIAMLGEMLLDFRRGRNQGNWFLNFFAPPQYWLVTAFFNVFPLPRLHGFRRSFSHAGEAMDRGYSVMVFPEGAVSREGGMKSFRQGIGLLAQEARIPILPVALRGLEGMQKSGWFRSGHLEIRVGEPIPVDEEAEPAELTAKLEKAVRDLLA